jgi:hypothetical protein
MRRTHRASAFGPDSRAVFGGEERICDAAECAETLKYLRGIFRLIKIDGEKAVVRWEVERLVFAGAEKVGYVFHLDEGHWGFLEFYSWRRKANVYKSTRLVSSI